MTVVVVMLPETPPTRLAETTPLDASDADRLRDAMLVDSCRAVAESGGDLLLNYPDPAAVDGDPEAEARDLAERAGATDARVEVQVGSTFSARAGNAVTHLLEGEGEATAAVVQGDAPLLTRTAIDGAAMRLRRDEVVLAPGGDGRVAYAGFADPLDFTNAFDAPALTTLTDRGRAADHDVDFLASARVVRTGADLAEVLVEVRARERAGRAVPTAFAAAVDDLGLDVRATGDGLAVVS
ncbi:MAG: DUF2064 domain-containing protein [Halobacteriaceae archaeon]